MWFRLYIKILKYTMFKCKLRKHILFLFIINLFLIVSFYTFINLEPTVIKNEEPLHFAASIDTFLPSNRFDLFWTMWNTHPSTFRGRPLLVLESIFIHHPNATIIMLSSTLNDTKLFAPFCQRGYRIHAFNVSLQHMIDWHWYTNNQTRDFLQNWNTSGPYFYSHVSDYLRTIALYLYGGTYLDMDALILQPLPQYEFIGMDRTELGTNCTWCLKNTPGYYVAPGFMRFQPNCKVLKQILENIFDRLIYNPNCFVCVGQQPYTYYISRLRIDNDPEVMNIKLLQPQRLYPFMRSNAYDIFHIASEDTPLQLADLMKRSYSLHLFGHMTDKFAITRGSLIDLLFHRFDLGDLRPKTLSESATDSETCLVYPSPYIHNPQKQGRFIGRDVIYLRLNHTLANDNIRWTINMRVSNGTILLPSHRPLSNLNQAQINAVLNQMSYKPFESTSIDTLMIEVNSGDVILKCSVTILIFSEWVTILTKTMGTVDRWPVVQQLVVSSEKFYPQTHLHIGSDSGQVINKLHFLNFTSPDGINGFDLQKTIHIHNLAEDAGLSAGRNYLVNLTSTPFCFLCDDDFVFEEDSHLDILLELIYTYSHIDIIAGKIPEDIRDFKDFSGILLLYNQTLDLVYNASSGHEHDVLFPHLLNNPLNEKIPCRQVNFVPNVFMGRTESVRSIRWNDEFKIGEHEDFFLRFGRANRTVYTCRHIHVHHHQKPWWKSDDKSYYKKRTRAYKYFHKMLSNHNLRRLIVFNYVHLDLDANPSESKNQ